MNEKIMQETLHIADMTCVNCQNKIEKQLRMTEGILNASVRYADGTAAITWNDSCICRKEIIQIIEDLGYEVRDDRLNDKKYGLTPRQRAVSYIVLIVLLFYILNRFGVLTLLVPDRLADNSMGYGLLFITGLVTSVHCFAMCGGINLSQCLPPKDALHDVQDEDARNHKNKQFLPAAQYNLGRVISYTVIGGILGTVGLLLGIGTDIGLSSLVQGLIKIIAGILMALMGLNMLNLIPALRKLPLHLPAGLRIRSGRSFGVRRRPFLVGLLNGLMPCGPLQAMQLVALASGGPLTGALSMLFFSLGTVPLMMGFGSIITSLGRRFTRKVMTAGALIVAVMGLAMLSQGISLSGMVPSGSVIAKIFGSSADSVSSVADGTDASDAVLGGGSEDIQIVESTLASGQYPDIEVKAGIPVQWVIYAPEGSVNGCNYMIYISEYDIEYTFSEGENVIIFTPEETGTYTYSCWMGMITACITVIS